METSGFGPHLMLDLKDCNIDKLNDMRWVFDLLDRLPDEIGMTKITQPQVFPYSGLVPEDEGITGLVVIAESHITVHTFTKKNYVFIDVFSCKPFDYELTKQKLIDAFEAKSFESWTQLRGREFPR